MVHRNGIVGHSLKLCMFLFSMFTVYALPVIAGDKPPAGPIIATIPAGACSGGVALNAETNRIYVGNCGEEASVGVIDGNTNTVIATIPLENNPFTLAVNPITNRIYVCCFNDDKLSVIDGKTNTITATIPIAKMSHDVAINPATNRIYVTGIYDTMYVIDGNTNAVITKTKVEQANDGQGIVVDPGTNRIYLLDRGIKVLDGKTNEELACMWDGTLLALNAVACRLYAINSDNNAMRVINGKTNALLATVKLGKGAVSAAVNPTTGQVFVCCAADHAINVLDGDTNTVRTTIPLDMKSQHSHVAVNSRTNRLYVTVGKASTVYVIDGNTFLTAAELAKIKTEVSLIAPDVQPSFDEAFTEPQLNLNRWMVTESEKFPEERVAIVNRGVNKPWLNLHMDTSTLPNGKFKYHGVRTKNALIDFDHPTEIRCTLDLNNPAAELAEERCAGLYICPWAEVLCPGKDSQGECLKVMYYEGVEKSTARLEIVIEMGDTRYQLYDENYRAHKKDPAGGLFNYRQIGVVQLRIVVDKNSLAVWENDKQVYQGLIPAMKNSAGKVCGNALPWGTGYLYLQQEVSTQLPVRDVFFSDIHVRQLPEPGKPTTGNTETTTGNGGNKANTTPTAVTPTTPTKPAPATPTTVKGPIVDLDAPFIEQFTGSQLDPKRWMVVEEEKHPGSTIEVAGKSAHWLHFHVDPSLAPNVKKLAHGVRSQDVMLNMVHHVSLRYLVDLGPTSLAANTETNLFICPDPITKDPEQEAKDYLKIGYYGDEAATAYLRVTLCIQGKTYSLYDQGKGAPRGNAGTADAKPAPKRTRSVYVVVDNCVVNVWEDGKQLCHCVFANVKGVPSPLPWPVGYLYLQQSAAAGSPACDVSLTNLRVIQLPDSPEGN